jgi:predicted ATP-grasp superfamily ATP-dependent carboligase
MDSTSFEIRDVIDIDLTRGTLIECFPSISALALIITNIILESKSGSSDWSFDQVSVGTSNKLPSVCVVYYSKPKFPIRVYASAETRIAILASEVPQYTPITREIGKKIYQWTKKKGIERIISIDGFKTSYIQSPREMPLQVFGVGTIESCRNYLQEKRIASLDHGVIKGLSAVLLNEGWYDNSEVIILLGEVRQHYPVFLTAVRVIEVLNQLIPLDIKIEPILAKADHFEQLALSMRKEANAKMKTENKPFW